MMINNFSFFKMPVIHFGSGMFNKLYGLIEKNNAPLLIVTGFSSFRQSNNWKELNSYLLQNGVEYFELKVKSEPSPKLIDSEVLRLKDKDIKLVIGIGGGSVLDTAKAISAMLRVDDSVVNYLEGVGTKEHPGDKIPFIAIPTTSGTGSEATKNAVLSSCGEKGFKKSIRHENFIPDYAIVDPKLTVGCPADITAACGMDALTQLIESYTSTNSNEITDALSYSGLEYISKQLIKAFDEGDNLEARTAVTYASMISGITLANAGLGVIHGMASAAGGFFNIPHGVFCGTLLAAATEANVKKLKTSSGGEVYLEKYANIGNLFKMGNSIEERTNILIDKLKDITLKLRMPRLSSFGIDEAGIKKIVKNTGNKNNPVDLTDNELYEILKKRL